MSTPVEKIKERLSITEVIETYIKLERAGSNLKGKCPFHNEKTPSFFVSPERGSYYCFGCGAKGDIFSFVQAFEGLDFMGALKLLADRAGIQIVSENPKTKSEKENLFSIMDEASRYYEKLLWNNSEALDYLRRRGLTDDTIKEFRLGFVSLEWRSLYNHLLNLKYKESDIEKVGLIKKTEKGYYDRFRGRIMFPITDSSGRVIAFTGRILVDDGKSAKYLNSPDTVLFDKSSVLYGIDKAKIEIRKKNFSILVEGQMDLIMCHQAGFKNAVAGSGTALTDSLYQDRVGDVVVNHNDIATKEKIINNLGVVKRLSSNIIMVYDSDKAGMSAAVRSAQIALGLGMDVKIGQLPQGSDPADLILEDKEKWKDVLRNAKHVIEFELDVILSSKIDSRKLPKVIMERILPLIAVIGGNMEKSHFISVIKDRTGISESAIMDDLRLVTKQIKENVPKINREQVSGIMNDSKASVHRKEAVIKKIIGIILWQESLSKETAWIELALKEIIGTEMFNKIKSEMLEKSGDYIFEAEVVYGKSVKLKDDLQEILLNLKEDSLKDQLAEAMKELSSFEKNKDDTKASEILIRCHKLSQEISDLRKSSK